MAHSDLIGNTPYGQLAFTQLDYLSLRLRQHVILREISSFSTTLLVGYHGEVPNNRLLDVIARHVPAPTPNDKDMLAVV